MLRREFYVCTKCQWGVAKGEIMWGLVTLKSLPQRKTIKPPCSACGRGFEPELHEEQFVCPKCGYLLVPTDHTIKNDNVPEVMGTGYNTPIHSDALAIMPDQVEEHRKLFPKIELDTECRPVFTNAKDHQKYMDKIGVVKRTQKIKSRGKIYSIPGGQCS